MQICITIHRDVNCICIDSIDCIENIDSIDSIASYARKPILRFLCITY